jgi:F-type H+-transporting ATPase subunit b
MSQALSEFIAELIALVVMAWVIWRYVVPPVRKMMRNQQEAIRKQVEDGKRASERLAEAEKKYQDALAEARTEAAKIRDTARADGQRIVEEMRAAAEREVERIRQRGQDDLAAQRQQVVRELRARIGELTVTSASELVHRHLSTDTRRGSTVDRFLDELDAMTARETAPSAKGEA